MKKILVLMFLLLLLVGCSEKSDKSSVLVDSDKVTSNDSANFENSEKYFKIYTGSTSEDHFSFYYDLYGKQGEKVKHECTYMNEPDIEMLTKYIIKVSVQSGTGLSTRRTYYYDLDKNKFSKTFYYVLGEKESYVAFFDGKKIIISDMFEENRALKEIQLKEKLVNSTDPVESVVFSDDLSEINVTYFSSDKSEKINEKISLK